MPACSRPTRKAALEARKLWTEQMKLMEEDFVGEVAVKKRLKAVSTVSSGLAQVVGPKPKPLGRWAKDKKWSNEYSTYI